MGRRPLAAVTAFLATVAILAAACGGGGSGGTTTTTSTKSTGTTTSGAHPTITIGTTNFAEELVLGNLYADVLRAKGFKVVLRPNLGSRQVVFPALRSGQLDLVPEYTGALLQYLEKESTAPLPADPGTLLATLRSKLAAIGMVALTPAPAEDGDALAVTQATASRYHLSTVSSLAPVAGKLVAGGPPEFQTLADGIPGLAKVYGIHFKAVRSLDAGGPLTFAALLGNQVQVARVFSTDGRIAKDRLVVLTDDKHLVPSQHILPVVLARADSPKLSSALDALSAKLTTPVMVQLNAAVTINHDDPGSVAQGFLQRVGLG